MLAGGMHMWLRPWERGWGSPATFISLFFSAPEPKAQVHYCDHTLSVVRPSVVRRPSVVNFSHFRLLLWNRWTEFNETWQEARSQRPLPSLCFSGRSEKQYGRPGLWLAETFSTSPLKPLNGIQWNLTGSKISMSSTKFVFFGPIRKTKWPPWPLIGWDIFDFSSEIAERNSTKLDRKQDLNVLYQVCVCRADPKNKMAALASDWLRHFRLLLWNRWMEFNESWQEARSQRPLPSLCFFGPIGKTIWPPWPLIGWDIFDFSSEIAERNSTKLDRKQDLNVLYQVCVCRADPKNKMAVLASDWLRHFRLLLWNHWTEFNETWQEARSQRPLPSLCFSGRSEKQYGRPGLWLAEIFSTSPLKSLNGIQRNLTGSKISMSSTKFVFVGPIRKTKWPPWPLNWLRHFRLLLWNRWMEFNESWQEARSQCLYQVCVFRVDQKTKIAALADSSKRWHIELRCTICGPLGLLFILPNKEDKKIGVKEGGRTSHRNTCTGDWVENYVFFGKRKELVIPRHKNGKGAFSVCFVRPSVLPSFRPIKVCLLNSSYILAWIWNETWQGCCTTSIEVHVWR